MKPSIVLLGERSLTTGDRRSRRSARLYAQIAQTYRVVSVARVAIDDPAGDVELGTDFIERRIPRTAAEHEWQMLAAARRGPVGGDDALVFDRALALNPAYAAAVTAASAAAVATICIRPYTYAVAAALATGPVVYDALELEYPACAAASAGLPWRETYLETVVQIEERCMTRASLVLTGNEIDTQLAQALYGLAPARLATLPYALDPTVAPAFDKTLRAARKAALNLAGRQIVFFVGSASAANAAATLTVCGIATQLSEVQFIVAGRVFEILPLITLPSNVHFTGWVEDGLLTRLYEAADILVCPGPSRAETPIKVIDAVAHGAALALTPEIAGTALRDGVDADVAPLDELAARIRALLADSDRRERQARSAYAAARECFAIANTAAILSVRLSALTFDAVRG